MKTVYSILGGFAGALSLTLGAAALAQAPMPDDDVGRALFDQRCASCHAPAIDRAPDREEMARRTADDIVSVLTSGSMAPMAAGLSDEQKFQIAFHLSNVQTAGMSHEEAPVPAGEIQPADNMCEAQTPVVPTNQDWNNFGNGLSGHRLQTSTPINAGNVADLEVKWSFAVAGGKYGQPTVIGDHMFLTTYGGHAYALNANSGCVFWRRSLNDAARAAPVVGERDGRWVVYVGDRARDVWALDAVTGETLWRTHIEPHPRALITGSPILHDGVLYVPTSSSEETISSVADYSCCTFSGAVTAIDVDDGEILWQTKMLEEPQPTRLNEAGTQMFGPAGAAIWSQPTVDPERGLVYVATGDSYTEIDAPLSDAIVALEMDTGAVRWGTQVTENDNFLVGCGRTRRAINCPLGEIGPDVDFGASPIIADLPNGETLILSGQKSGVVWAMNPDTGEVVWEHKVGFGSAVGGIEWGMAYDGEALVVSVNDSMVPRPDFRGGVYALDPATGEYRWEAVAPEIECSFDARRCSNGQSAPPSLAPGLVFAGGQDAVMRAYDIEDGSVLWTFDAAGQTYDTENGVDGQVGGSFDATGPVLANGMMYAISGYVGSTGAAYGNPLNVLIAFGLAD